jgi:hypothetical protein
MSSMKNKNGIGFTLAKINTMQFATIDMQIEDQAEIDIRANIDFGVSNDNQRGVCITKFEFQHESKPIIILEVNCEFQFNDETWESLSGKTEIELPTALLQHLAVLTIGTIRGILHAKTENTAYNKYYLPTLNVTEMIKEDLKFPID